MAIGLTRNIMATKKQQTNIHNRFPKTTNILAKEENGNSFSRRLFVMRHGERCDFTFGKTWMRKCFDEDGIYKQTDLNLPKTMIKRQPITDYSKDSPLTELGMFQARATGDAFRKADVDIKNIYVSPSLRCVQTAQNVIEGLDNNAKMCIEPSAFEWFGWYKNAMPHWLTADQLSEQGFNINVKHKPFVQIKDLHLDETVTDYYERCHRLAEHILKKHEEEGGDILIVAHAGSLDTFTRQLRGRNPRTSQEMHHILASFTYCCLCCLAQDEKSGSWCLSDPPIPTLGEFDWKVLL
ncbi:unnamed protein product [Lymnaea stagnalis]|uniref:Uncharacterized protein n=1 Tax=Lymnaea stagnalis TaxID=6523 RepID=A0AAV2HYK0_LYMST